MSTPTCTIQQEQQSQSKHKHPPRSPTSSQTMSSPRKKKTSSSSSFGWRFGGGSKGKSKNELRIRTDSSMTAGSGSSPSTSGYGGGSPSVAATLSSSSPAASVLSAASTSPSSASIASLGTGRMLKCGSVTFEPSPTAEQMMVMNGDRDYVTNDSIAVTSRVSVHGTADDHASPSSPIHSNNTSSSRPTHGTETTLVSSPKQRQPSTTTKVTACSTTTSGASGDKIYTDTGGGGAQAGDSSGSSGSLVTKIFERRSFSFLRVADLEMDETITMASVTSDETTVGATSGGSTTSTSSNGSSDLNMTAAELINNIHHASVDPPPGVDHDPKERWIAFTTDRDGSHAPIAPYAMDRLANFGLTTSLNETMWNPADNKTSALIKNGQVGVDWFASTFKPGKIKPCPGLDTNDAVMVWSGSFIHGLYGSDLPAIRAAGIVNMSARSLFDLLVDSTRVKEYNKLSLGRKDLVTFEGDLDTAGPFGRTITKVMRSETKPPMIRKTLVFESILHAKELVDGSGYLIVTRAIHHPGDDSSDHSLTSVIKSEILMGVNLIRKVEGQEDSRCCMINVNHIRSPMVPMMVAKRIGISSAVGFMNDVRALC